MKDQRGSLWACREGVQLHSCVCEYSVVQTPSVELSWHPCQKSIDHKCKDLFLHSQFYSNDLYIYSNATTTLS